MTTTQNTEQPATGKTKPVVKAPKWLLVRDGLTQRGWRKKKRRELRELIRVFEIFRLGCAYCPGKDGEVGRIDQALTELKRKLSVKEWL